MKWEWLPFAELTAKQAYDMLQLRETVFHLEQRSMNNDLDNIDIQAKHLLGFDNETLIAYLRVYLENDVLYIGRIIIDKEYRGAGMGRMMVDKTVEKLQKCYPGFPICVRAQYAQQYFYQKLHFMAQGEPFDDAGVSYVKMLHVPVG